MNKRYRLSKAKAGELKLQWGRLNGDNPDIVFSWGEGCHKADSHLLSHRMCSECMAIAFTKEEREKYPFGHYFVLSMVDDLKARGYDITTIKFSIQKVKA